MCILREFHGTNAYLCNNYINMFPLKKKIEDVGIIFNYGSIPC